MPHPEPLTDRPERPILVTSPIANERRDGTSLRRQADLDQRLRDAA